nr:MATE family efflux transporter [Sporanaerobium hydrogeniformans]
MQSFITSSLNLVDNMMVGNLGEASIAAVGLANQYIFIFTLCLMGVNAGASVFMSQLWGKQELKGIKTFLGVDMTVGFMASLLFGIGAFSFPEVIMGVLSKDREVIRLGADYLRIVAMSCLFMNFTQGYSSALRSTEQTKVPMFASLIGVLANAFLNWVFIFGNLGMPKMGVKGAALATTLARLLEMTFIISVVYFSKNKVAAHIKELFSFNMECLKKYFITSWSVIANELIFSIGLTFYSIAYARIGTNAVATMQIATTLNNMFMIFLIGIATAAAIMIGNSIGAGKEERARTYSVHVGKLTPLVGVLLGVFIWFLAPFIVSFFKVQPETYRDTVSVLRIMALFLPLRAFNMVMIVGVFRGGGDTLYSMLVQAGTIWLYSVPLSFIGALILKLPVYGVFFLICTEEIIKMLFELSRLKSGKWLKNLV